MSTMIFHFYNSVGYTLYLSNKSYLRSHCNSSITMKILSIEPINSSPTVTPYIFTKLLLSHISIAITSSKKPLISADSISITLLNLNTHQANFDCYALTLVNTFINSSKAAFTKYCAFIKKEICSIDKKMTIWRMQSFIIIHIYYDFELFLYFVY